MIHYLDTQIMVWLSQRQLDKLSPRVITAIEESQLLISPMVLLELEYLYELKRIIQPPQSLFSQLDSQIGLQVCEHSFSAIVQTAILETWTRDLFDRVIVAHAKSNGYASLITSDGKIRENYPKTTW